MGRQVWPCLVALLCLTAGCGTAATVVAGAQSLQVPDPGPGTVNAALLRFDLGVGTPAPTLRLTNGYRPPATGVFVAGVAPDPTLPNGYVGLVAIADFKGQGQQRQRRSGAGIAASQEFSIAFSGDAAYARNEVAPYDGLAKHGSWTVSWYSTANGSQGAQVSQDGARLLDEIASQLRGAASPGLLAALAGQPAPPVAAVAPGGSPDDASVAAGALGGSLGTGFTGGLPGGTGFTGGSGTRSGTGSGPAAVAGPAAALSPWAQALLFPSSAAGPAGPVSGESQTPAPPDQPPASPSPDPGTPSPSPSPSPTPTGPPGPQVTASVVTVDRGPGILDPGTVVNVSTSCPGGTAMTGGGAIAASPSGEDASRGLVLVSAMPVGASGAASSFWGVGAAPSGAAVADAVTEDFAVCLISRTSMLTNVIATASVPGPSAASPVVTATATCPAGTVLAGGGGGVQAPAGSAPSVTLTASYPSTPRGGVLTSGGPSAWSAVGVAGPSATSATGAGGATTSAVAVCITAGTVVSPRIVTATAPVPALPGASGPALVVASCPAGSLLLSGGFRIDGGSVPDAHLRGSYPSDASGLPVSDAPVIGSWSSIVEGDGPTPATATTFALCA